MDVGKALRQVGGNAAFLKKLLEDFHRGHAREDEHRPYDVGELSREESRGQRDLRFDPLCGHPQGKVPEKHGGRSSCAADLSSTQQAAFRTRETDVATEALSSTLRRRGDSAVVMGLTAAEPGS
jgi:hypothetical protein